MAIPLYVLKGYRQKYQISLQSLAAATGITPLVLEKIESGEVTSPAIQRVLCRFFGIKPAILFPENEPPVACRRLKQYREMEGLSLEDLGKKLLLKSEWIAGFESGEIVIWPAAISKLCRFFSVPETELFPEKSSGTMFTPCVELRKARCKAGLSQSQLGFKSSLSPCYISRFENGCGPTPPWPGARFRLSQALGIPQEKLFPELFSVNEIDSKQSRQA